MRAHDRGEPFARDPEAAAFVAEGRAPAAGARFVARGVAAERDRAGAGDDHDARAEADRAGERDARVGVDDEVAARKEDAAAHRSTRCRCTG